MSDTPRTDVVAKLRYMARQYTNGQIARGGNPQKHYLDEAADEIETLRKRAELAELTVSQKREQIASCEAALDEANRRAGEAEKDANLLRKQNEQMTELNQGQFLQIEYLRPIFKAAKNLSDEAEEYDFSDGLGQGAQQCWWDALNDALEPKTDAIADEMKNG